MTAAKADQANPAGITTALYLRTKALHVEAERTGIIRDLLRGEATREGYILLLRNLLPAYQALERGLERHRKSPVIGVLAGYDLDRSSAIEADLAALGGASFNDDIPLLNAGSAYAARIAQAAEGDSARLIAHAYTRYLGDLNGGQILQRLLSQSLGLEVSALTFYDFPRFQNLDSLKADYRVALDAAGGVAPDPQAVIEEGALAFSLNIDLSCAVKAALPQSPAAIAAAE